MYKHYPQPTVIGTGLTGLLISLALSKAGVKHVLIGGPPPAEGPRLGESLNLEATIYFLTEYPELADCYYHKQFAATYTGGILGTFDFSFVNKPQSAMTLGFWGRQVPERLIHFDRVRVDAALYEKATESPFCTHLDVRVSSVQCAPNTDRIQRLVLADDATLPVSHVFDATGHIRLLARHLQLPRQILGQPQRVVYTHYYRRAQGDTAQPSAEWQHGTNVMRLYKEYHGFDILAWCIPLGNTISVGLTTPQENADVPDEALLQCVREAFTCYGVDYGSLVDRHSRIGKARMEFYTHPCAFGSNWLLAAAAHTQVWWPTSAGVDTSVAAANVAVPFLRNPKTVGKRYQAYIDSLVPSQSLWQWAATHHYGALTSTIASAFVNRLFWSIGHRLFRSFALDEQAPLLRTLTSLAVETQGMEFWSRLPMAPAKIRQIENPVPRHQG